MDSGQLATQTAQGAPAGPRIPDRGRARGEETYLDLLLANTPNALLLLDSDGRVAYCSEKFRNLAGIETQNSLEGLHFREAYRTFASGAFVDHAERLFETAKKGRSIQTDVAIKFPGTGETRSYTVHYTPLLDRDGAFAGVQILCHDVTELQTETDDFTRLMLDATPLPCSMWDMDGSMITVNLHTLQLFGFARRSDRPLFAAMMELGPERQDDGTATVEKIRAVIQKVLRTGYEQTEFLFRTAGGEPLPLEISLIRIPWRNGYRIVTYLKDLRIIRAERQKAREAEERIRSMLNSMPLACSLWDDHENVLDCNDAALRIFGLASVEEYRKHILNLSPEFQGDGVPSREAMNEKVRKALETGYQQFEWTHRDMKGELFPVETTIVRIPLTQGWQVAIYARDLRDIKAQEAATRKADERMRLMLDVIPMACIFLDDTGECIDCNASTPKFFGMKSKEEFLAHPLEWMPEYQPDGRHSQTEKRRLVQEVLKTGSKHFEWIHRIAGEDAPTAVWLGRVEWNNMFSVAAYIRDLRDQKAAEEKAREADRRSREMEVQTLAARAASEAKSSFLATMSHEIRTPLNAIIGLSEIELQKDIPEDTRADLEKIYRSGSNLLGIINDVLDISRIETGNLELVPEAYDIPDLINDTVQLNVIRIGLTTMALGFTQPLTVMSTRN